MQEFESYLRYDRQLASGTIRNYVACIGEFRNFLQKDLARVEKEDITRFVMALEGRKMSKAGMGNYISAFRAYFNWLAYKTQSRELISLTFFLAKIIKVRRDRKIPVVPTLEEVKRLRKTLEAHKKAISFSVKADLYQKIIQEIAAIELLITTGLRSKELRNLKYSDVDLKDKVIFVRAPKGNCQRISLFNGSAFNALKEYFDNNNFAASDMIFPYRQGNILNYIIKRWAARAGINQKIHAHSFRHFFITESQRQGVPIEIVAEQVGHRNINTTRLYTHYNIAFLRERFSKCKI